MAKLMKQKCIFEKTSYKGPVKFGEITIALEPDDEIIQTYVEPYNGTDEGWEAHYQLEVFRMVEETDAEYEKRLEEGRLLNERLREGRYQNYLKLKKEFENEEN